MKKLEHIFYTGDKCLIHTRNDIAVLVQAYNLAVDRINYLEERINKLEKEVQHGTG